MLQKKSVVQKSILVLMGLLLALTAVACNTPVKTEAETETVVETVTAVSQPRAAVPQTAVQHTKMNQRFSRSGQTADPAATAPADDSDAFFDGVDWFAVAAQAAGMDDEAMWDALMNGASIAELVTANGGDPVALADNLVTAETAWINGMVETGDLTAQEAADWTATLAADVESFVNDSSWALWEGVDWFTLAAETIGVDEDAIWEADSIAAVAQANGVESQTVIDAIVAAESAWIDDLTAEGELTAEEATEWKATLDEDIRAFVEESWEMVDFGGVGMVDWFTLAAETIGVDEDALWEADSIAAVAQANGVENQTVIDAIVAAETAVIEELVANGELTAQDAADWTAGLDEEARLFVEESWDMGLYDEFVGVDWFVTAAEALNMDEETMWEALDSGQSIADIATAQGMEAQTIIDAITTAETAMLTEMAANGDITQAEADEWAAEIAADAAEFVNDNSWAMWEGVDWYAIAQEALGMDEDAMWEALDSGQSIAELAAARGVDTEPIAAAITTAETAWLNEMVANGELTQADVDEWVAEIEVDVDLFLNEAY